MLEVVKWCKRLKWKIGLIPRVEILKMASKMAASKALKTYLTNKLYKKHLILTFNGCLEVEWFKRLKWKIGLVQKVQIFKMVSNMATILKQNPTWSQLIVFFPMVFNIGCIWIIWLAYCCCFLRFKIFKMTSKMAAITEWGVTWFL